MRELIKKILKEDFDWVKNSKFIGEYRYFDFGFCYDSSYEDGEDICNEESSVSFKVPIDVVGSLWDHEINYWAGPDDEGLALIEWCHNNGVIKPEEYACGEYVTEIDQTTYCLNEDDNFGDEIDKIICGGL